MKLYALIPALTCACLLSVSYPCAAAFPLGSRQQQAVKDRRNVSDSFLAYNVQNTVIHNALRLSGEETQAPKTEQKGGGFGSAALICGVLGIWPAAIILGIIGLEKGRANRYLARAGLILGIVQGAFFLFILIFLVLIM